MHKKRTPIIVLFLVTVVLTSCNTGSRFASSFGKRKYTRGYYVDVPAGIKKQTPAEPGIKIAVNTNKTISREPWRHTEVNSTIHQAISKTEAKKLVAVKKISSSHNIEVSVGLKKLLPDAILYPGKENSPSDVTIEKTSGDVNYYAIAGLALVIAVVIIGAIDQFLPILAMVFLILGVVLCVYALFKNKIYLTWLAVIGLSFVIIFLVLLAL